MSYDLVVHTNRHIMVNPLLKRNNVEIWREKMNWKKLLFAISVIIWCVFGNKMIPALP